MKPHCDDVFSRLSFCNRPLRLSAIAIALLLLLPFGQTPTQAAASGASTAHVYLLRGVLNIFSLGLDDIAAKLRAKRHPGNRCQFRLLVVARRRSSGQIQERQIKTIILVGHSSGATSLPDMVSKLDRHGVPVKLAIGLDSVFSHQPHGRVGHYINFYIANGAGTPVEKRKGFQGSLENVNVENVPGVGHMSIEKNQIMQQKVIGEIDAVVFGRSAPVVAGKPRPGKQRWRRSTRRGETGKRGACRE